MLIELGTGYTNTKYIERIECYSNEEENASGKVEIDIYMVSGDVIKTVQTKEFHDNLIELISSEQ
nr:MAG TPA_asm: hypothetical protein [Caudoviricetes sp.]